MSPPSILLIHPLRNRPNPPTYIYTHRDSPDRSFPFKKILPFVRFLFLRENEWQSTTWTHPKEKEAAKLFPPLRPHTHTHKGKRLSGQNNFRWCGRLLLSQYYFFFLSHVGLVSLFCHIVISLCFFINNIYKKIEEKKYRKR